jgi:hypothetical protein
MAHKLFCKCKRCTTVSGQIDSWLASSKKKQRSNSGNNFSTKNKKGETIYGDKRLEGRPGHKHGHDWQTGGRTPHSSVGHSAVQNATNAKPWKHRYGK